MLRRKALSAGLRAHPVTDTKVHADAVTDTFANAASDAGAATHHAATCRSLDNDVDSERDVDVWRRQWH
jgi:hypothetical protein